VIGTNRMFRVAVWLGLRVSGRATPDTVNPVPVTAIALIVTGAVPVEVNVTDCVVTVLRFTDPKAMLAAFTFNVATLEVNCNANVLETPLALAVSVAV